MKSANRADTPSPPRGAAARSPNQVIPTEAKWVQSVAAWLVCIVEHVVTLSLRCQWRDSSGLTKVPAAPPVIFCLWHNRLALSMLVHRRFPRKLAALISASKDGALLACALGKYNVQAVRGSTSRRGPQALLELAGWAQAGYDVAITPDGPRGPRYVVQKGVIALAQVTGRPIVAVTYNTRWKICMKSWDGFQIPLPFARCEMVVKEPFHVPPDASESQREELRTVLEQSLRGSSRD